MYRPSVPVLPIGLTQEDEREVRFSYAVRPIHSNEFPSLPFEGNDTILMVTTNVKGKISIEKVRYQQASNYTTQFSQFALGKR